MMIHSLSAGHRGKFLVLTLIYTATCAVFGVSELSAQPGCVGPTGTTQVSVDLIRDAFGNPVIESNGTTRRESVRITSSLRDELGLTVPEEPGEDVRPQIRLIVETDNSGLRSTANFTVEEVIFDTAMRVEIYDAEEPDDEDSGAFKLFGLGGFDSAATLTVHAAAPSRTTVDDGVLTAATQSFCEPSGNHAPGEPNAIYGFFEHVNLRASRDFVLLVPHGGMIEDGTSEQVDEIRAAFAARNQPVNTWEAAASWEDGLASDLFHITSTAIDPQGFPGLDALLTAGDFDAARGIEFQYAASLHGFGSFDRPGIVFGGRASRESKCYVARQIQQRLISEGEPAIAFYIYDSDGDPANAIDLPGGDGLRISDQRRRVGLTGRSCDNLVNRLAQGPGCIDGHGGVQIQESAALRSDLGLRTLVSEEIANGFSDLVADPSLIDPSLNTFCNVLSTSEIGDRVWVDLNADGIQDAGEPGREGITVQLLDGAFMVATATTEVDGSYLFENLTASPTYTVRVTAPVDFTFSPPGQGGEAVDSDVNTLGETLPIPLAHGVSQLDVDAGLVPGGVAGQVGDLVWHDDNANGVREGGEPGISGIQVDLTTALGTPVASTTTDASGNYLFSGLLPGDYLVSFLAPGWILTTPPSIPFTLGADVVDLSRDAGFDLPPVRLDLIGNSTAACGPPPANPNATDRREHLFMSQTLATQLGIDAAAVQLTGPSPQVRVIVDSPLLTSGDTSTAAYTVARICASNERRIWVWNDVDRLFPGQTVTLATLELTVEPMAPSRTLNGGLTTQHFDEPTHATAGAKHLRENVTIVPDKRVALLIPHGGGMELNTSRQINAFVDELDDATGPVEVNVWEVQGQWGSGETFDRWHITSNDIHPDGFPGLDALLAEPLFDAATGQQFEFAASFHGFADSTDFGIILGGLADRDLRCHVAATIRAQAGSRGAEIGFHIAEAAIAGGDLLVPNNRSYVPAPGNVQALEGQSDENIVNWVTEAVAGGDTTWSGIQLEQSLCVRRETSCSALSVAACTVDQPECMHNLVAAGVARAIEEILDGSVDPAGACCTHFADCP